MLQVPNQLRHEGEHVASPDHEAHGLRVLVRGVREEVHLRGRPQSAQEAQGVRRQVRIQVLPEQDVKLFPHPAYVLLQPLVSNSYQPWHNLEDIGTLKIQVKTNPVFEQMGHPVAEYRDHKMFKHISWKT